MESVLGPFSLIRMNRKSPNASTAMFSSEGRCLKWKIFDKPSDNFGRTR
jgi:hypothetical protein